MSRASSHRWLPTTVFGLLAAGFLALGVIQVRNVLAHPSVDRFTAPGGDGAIILYHKSRRSRAADVIFEYPDDGLALVAPIFYSGKNRDGGDEVPFDSLYWTADQQGFYATGHGGELLWLFEPGGRWLSAGNLARDRFQAHGGAGELVVRWFEIGGTEGSPRLKTWETTRYEKVLRQGAGAGA